MTLETEPKGFDSESRRPKYPHELVHRYGAKAGILIYVAEHLPDIPQAPMVVSEIGESADSLLARADAKGIGWPRLFRSSAEAELLGYEGYLELKRLNHLQKVTKALNGILITTVFIEIKRILTQESGELSMILRVLLFG